MKYVNKKKAEGLLEKGAALIDIRSPVDYRNGHIEGSQNLPLRNFINRLSSFDKKKNVILIVNNINFDTDLKTVDTYAEQLGFSKIFATEYKQLLED